MPLEPVLANFLASDATLSSYLARFGTPPTAAIFDRLAPADTDRRWNSGVQYPRLIYVLRRAVKLSDIITGSLQITIWHRDDIAAQTGVDVATVRARLLQLLNENALGTSDEGAFVFKFVSETPFQGSADAIIVGSDLQFEFRQLEPQSTFTPDPATSFVRWGTARLPSTFQWTPSSFAPTDSTPAVFPRITRRHTDQQDFANFVRWYDVDVDFHVFAPSVNARAYFARQVADQLRQDIYIKMDDGSCMYVTNLDESLNTSPLNEGQVKASARYGTLADPNTFSPGTLPPPWVTPTPPTGTSSDGLVPVPAGGGTPITIMTQPGTPITKVNVRVIAVNPTKKDEPMTFIIDTNTGKLPGHV